MRPTEQEPMAEAHWVAQQSGMKLMEGCETTTRELLETLIQDNRASGEISSRLLQVVNDLAVYGPGACDGLISCGDVISALIRRFGPDRESADQMARIFLVGIAETTRRVVADELEQRDREKDGNPN